LGSRRSWGGGKEVEVEVAEEGRWRRRRRRRRGEVSISVEIISVTPLLNDVETFLGGPNN
jgi:hypothetical protein